MKHPIFASHFDGCFIHNIYIPTVMQDRVYQTQLANEELATFSCSQGCDTARLDSWSKFLWGTHCSTTPTLKLTLRIVIHFSSHYSIVYLR